MIRKASILKCTVLLVLLPLFSVAQIYTIETIPNPKEENNTYVSDPAYSLSRTTVDYLNDLLDSLERETTAQVAVVVLPSIGTADITTFAQALFEKWGIGQRDKDNGLLILLVIDQRTIRFHTGYGLEGILPDVTCKRIQEEFMVPYFRNENYDIGLIEGVKVVSQILKDPEIIHEIYNTSVEHRKIIHVIVVITACLFGFFLIPVFFESWNSDKFTASVAAPRLTISIWWWLTLYILLPAAFFFITTQFRYLLWSFLSGSTYSSYYFLLNDLSGFGGWLNHLLNKAEAMSYTIIFSARKITGVGFRFSFQYHWPSSILI